MHPTLKKWHQYFDNRDLKILDEILAKDVSFHSPVVHTPQNGKKITMIYLSSAFKLLADPDTDHDFKYIREVTNDRHFMMEFKCSIDGIQINGIDMIEINDEGKIINFKVMIRPIQAINIVHKKMGEMLKKNK